MKTVTFNLLEHVNVLDRERSLYPRVVRLCKMFMSQLAEPETTPPDLTLRPPLTSSATVMIYGNFQHYSSTYPMCVNCIGLEFWQDVCYVGPWTMAVWDLG